MTGGGAAGAAAKEDGGHSGDKLSTWTRAPRRCIVGAKEGRMAHAGDTIENPATGERIVFRRTAADTGGELLLFDLFLKPHGFIPVEHLHARQEERVEVVAGSLRYRLGGRGESLATPESAGPPPGLPHT